MIKKALSLYKNLSSAVKAAFWFTFSNVIQKTIVFITLPIFTRLMTPEQFGVYNIFYSWLDIMIVFSTFNLTYTCFHNALIKYNDQKGLTSSFQFLTTITTTIILVIYLLNTSFWNSIIGLPTILVFIMFVHLYAYPAFGFWATKQRFEFKYKGVTLITILMVILSTALGILGAVYSDYKVEFRILASVSITAIVGVIFYVYNFYKGKVFFKKEYWIYAFSYSIPLLPYYLSQVVLNSTDRIMINALTETSKAGIYGVAYSLAIVLTYLSTGVNSSLIPWTYKRLKTNNLLDIGKKINYIVFIIGMITLLLILIAPEILWVFTTEEYYDAIWIIPPVALSTYLIFLYGLFVNFQLYIGGNKYVAIASILPAISNVILNYIFIPKYGYIAAGYTTLISYLLFTFINYGFMKYTSTKLYENKKIYDIKFIFLFSLSIFLFAILGMFTYYSIYRFVRYFLIFFIMLLIAFSIRKVYNNTKLN